ncbi:hypothetical protein [Pseudoduganella violaceinigra]|uniref:hypothetical protein n=1 Tax=Pseudoduganella violaceinigra TaxID=246602 RepID=UPI000416E758|nr:hypothetical protein [Pseudoduganella violaceinigra]
MQKHPVPRLTPQEFTKALHDGRGSAFIHVQEYGTDGLFDIILDACLNNRAYDRQCEDSREKWLYGLIARDEKLCAAVIEAFKSADEEHNIFQIANVVGQLAVHGNQEAAAALRRFWDRNDLAGEIAIIELDGLPAAIEVVRRLGQQLIDDPDEYFDGLDFLIEDETLRGQVLAELVRLAPHEPAIQER